MADRKALPFNDGIANLFSALGTSADRTTQSYYWVQPTTQQQIEAAYRSSWLTRKVHDLPPFEMTRAGRVWDAPKDQILLLEKAEKQLGLWAKLGEALRIGRLHGGGAIIAGVRVGGSADPSRPLDVERVQKDGLRYLRVVSRHQLSAPFGMETDPESDWVDQPAMYELRGAKGGRVLIHPSRVFPFHGAPVPAGALAVSAIDQFWGDPLLLSIKSAIENADTVQTAIAGLLHEMKQDVIGIPGLTEQIATEGAEEQLAARIDALNRFKSMFNALLLDAGEGGKEGAGAETWETRQLSFAQYPELLQKFLEIVGGAADIPVTRLLGISPGGLQSTGKGEQDDFNRMIAAQQGFHLDPVLSRLDEILIRSALGARDEKITYEFAPLDEPDEKEESENEKREAETVEIYARTNLIPADALAKAAANRMIESGRWPGLDQAIEASKEELGAVPDPEAEAAARAEAEAANDNTAGQADRMEQRGTVTRDQALMLIADASPRTLYVSRKLLTEKLHAYAVSIGLQGVLPADEMHVTVVRSRRPVDWMKVDEDYAWGADDKTGNLLVRPGGPRIVEPLGDKGAIVLLFANSHISYRHNCILREADGSHDYNEFQPHVTLAYGPQTIDLSAVEPYREELLFGPEIFEEIDDDWAARFKPS